ncbi:MAG: MurR/RpiR family transcriptional regulator [Ruthenibacterium sp.]
MNFSFDILSQISSGTNMFSQTELKLANFITADPNAALQLSISELAQACGISIATVSRFCRRLSLNGYQEFKLELMKAVSNSADIPKADDMSVHTQDDIAQLIQKVHTIHQYSLTKSMEDLDPVCVAKAVSLLESADAVHLFGSGSMLLCAMNAKLQFMQVSSKFHCDIDPAVQALGASLMTSNSVAIVFSYTGSTRDIIEITKAAKRRGAKIITITRYTQSILAELSDVILLCGVSEGPFQTGSACVKASVLYIIDVLYTEFCRRNPEESQRNKESTSLAVIGKLNPLKDKKK